MAAGHLVADSDFTHLGNGNFDLLVNTGWEFVALVFGENLDADDFAVLAVRQAKRGVFNIFGFFAENGAQEFFLGCQFGFTFGGDFAD
jgi:hypothetical protein